MATDENKNIWALIQRAQQKQGQLQEKLEEVQQWLAKLYTLIDQGRAILGDEPINTGFHEPESKPASQTPSKPEMTKPEKIREILEASNQPMKVRKIYDAFVDRYGPIKGKNGITIIRNALSKKSQWFVQNAEDKTWYLKDKDYPKNRCLMHHICFTVKRMQRMGHNGEV